MDSGGPKELSVRWGPHLPNRRGNFEGKEGQPIVKYRNSLP